MGVLLFPESKDARNGLVNCLLETSRFSEALAMLDELLATEPENFFCHRARVAALQGLGKEKEATVALETLSRIGNLGNEDIIRLGDLYHNLGLYDLSLLNYEKAIERTDKLSVSKYIRVASILIDRGSYEDCFRYLKKIENIFSTSFNHEEEKAVLLLKSQVLLATGKSDESRRILRSIVEKDPLEGKALILLADLAWKEKDYSTASLFFERAGKIENWEVESLIQHGRMLVELRDYEKAVKLLERAQLLKPQERVERFLKSIRNLLITSSIQL
jgi:tetratricopeptide (TPR) repeat protein